MGGGIWKGNLRKNIFNKYLSSYLLCCGYTWETLFLLSNGFFQVWVLLRSSDCLGPCYVAQAGPRVTEIYQSLRDGVLLCYSNSWWDFIFKKQINICLTSMPNMVNNHLPIPSFHISQIFGTCCVPEPGRLQEHSRKAHLLQSDLCNKNVLLRVEWRWTCGQR